MYLQKKAHLAAMLDIYSVIPHDLSDLVRVDQLVDVSITKTIITLLLFDVS